jgi:hypothetical protein
VLQFDNNVLRRPFFGFIDLVVIFLLLFEKQCNKQKARQRSQPNAAPPASLARALLPAGVPASFLTLSSQVTTAYRRVTQP